MTALIFYYLFPASAIFLYGIGLNRVIVMSGNLSGLGLSGIKSIFAVTGSVVLSYLFIEGVLVQVQLVELYPLVCVLIFIIISVFCEVIVRIATNKSTAEFTISLLSILLSVNESNSLADAVVISITCMVSFYLLSILAYTIRRRVELSNPTSDFKSSSLLFLSLAVIMVALASWNISWLNPGVCK
jgi:Na+-translocating ferredoxin:NAD+ oxidoreductase RnfA subunit